METGRGSDTEGVEAAPARGLSLSLHTPCYSPGTVGREGGESWDYLPHFLAVLCNFLSQ